ncbi:hypothetical protein MTO96_030990 [Rhipicephalus appendiculatus]
MSADYNVLESPLSGAHTTSVGAGHCPCIRAARARQWWRMPFHGSPVPSVPQHRRSSLPAAILESPRDNRETHATSQSAEEDVTRESSEKDDEPPSQHRPATRSMAKTCLLGVIYFIVVAVMALLLWGRQAVSKTQALVNANDSDAPLTAQGEITTASDDALCGDSPACHRSAALLRVRSTCARLLALAFTGERELHSKGWL